MEKPIIETCDGKVLGTKDKNLDGDEFYAFLGIPYGKAPIGSRRFKVLFHYLRKKIKLIF